MSKMYEWKGKEHGYEFQVFKLDESFSEIRKGRFDQKGGVYCFAKETPYDEFELIYIGQTLNLGYRTNLEQHHKGNCIEKNGPTHIHVYFEENGDERLSIEGDILAKNGDTPCNDENMVTCNVVEVKDGNTIKVKHSGKLNINVKELCIRPSGYTAPEIGEPRSGDAARELMGQFSRFREIEVTSTGKEDQKFRLICHVSHRGRNLVDKLLEHREELDFIHFDDSD